MFQRIRSAVYRDLRQAGWVTTGMVMLAIVGCGASEKKPDASTQATVTGTVTKGGKAIAANSDVSFFCEASGAQAGGKVDALGKFSLVAQNPKVGIPAGRYKVTIRPPVKTVAMSPSNADYQKMMMPGAAQAEASKATESEIPAEFQVTESTKLIFEITAGANSIPIELEKF